MLQYVNHTARDDLRRSVIHCACVYHDEQHVNSTKLAEDAGRGRRLSGLKCLSPLQRMLRVPILRLCHASASPPDCPAGKGF